MGKLYTWHFDVPSSAVALDCIRAQRITIPTIPPQELANGTVLVTGGSNGLSHEAER